MTDYYGAFSHIYMQFSGPDIPILAAVATYMTRDLHKNKGFYENILPVYTIDEFMIPGTFEALCREVQATGRVPQQHAFGRPPIPLHKQVLAFVWFIASAAIFPYQRYGRERPGTAKKPLGNP